MGWATGSRLCEDIWEYIREFIPEKEQEKVSAKLCSFFVYMDADDFEFDEGTPYWNYLKIYEPEDFKRCVEELEE